MNEVLGKLTSQLLEYRRSLDEIYSSPLSSRSAFRRYLSNLLICLAEIYASSLAAASKLSQAEIPRDQVKGFLVRSNVGREQTLRTEFRNRLVSVRAWRHFAPEPELSVRADLHALQDYLNEFTLHLPEIYEESFRLEEYAKVLLNRPTQYAATGMLTSLEHISHHHIIFVLPALQWAANPRAWKLSKVNFT